MSPLAENLALVFRRLPTSLLCRGLMGLISLFASTAMGSTVSFWLSNSLSEPFAPTLAVPAGAVSTIDVWVRPPTNTTLNGFSLNLASEQPGALEFTEVLVHNPSHTSGGHRHQIVFDSTTALYGNTTYNDLFLDADRIEKILGLTFLNDSFDLLNGGGVGPACRESEHCFMIAGSPAWRIATVTFQAGIAGTSTELFLEIGEHGLFLDGEDPTDTDAVFGESSDAVHTWVPGANPDHNGLPDAMINVVGSDADFDDDGDVDGRDFLIWQRGYGGTLHSEGDANGDQLVNGADLAVWQVQYGASAISPLIAAVPEPTSSVIFGLLLLCPAARNLARNARIRGIC